MIPVSLKNYILLIAVSLITVTPCQADFSIKHCQEIGKDIYDCGKVLLGAAHLESNAITWNSNDLPANVDDLIIELGVGGALGFSGESNFTGLPQNQEKEKEIWVNNGAHHKLASLTTSYSEVSMGLYFAPYLPGKHESHPDYSAYNDSFEKNIHPTIKGFGVDDYHGALSLEIEIISNETMLSNGGHLFHKCQDNTPQCNEIILPQKGSIIFQITPRLDKSKLPAQVSIPEYVMINLLYQGNGTECTPGLRGRTKTFETYSLTPDNIEDQNNYYHYLGKGGPKFSHGACAYNAPFLVSVGKTFQVMTHNKRITGNGFANFTFAINGHLDRNNPEKYPGGQLSYRLKTTTSDKPAIGSLHLIVNGKGSVSSNPDGFFNCQEEDMCRANFLRGSAIALTATPSAGVSWSKECKQGYVEIKNTDTTCTVSFPDQLGEKSITKNLEISDRPFFSDSQFFAEIIIEGEKISLQENSKPVNLKTQDTLKIDGFITIDSVDIGKEAEIAVVIQIGKKFLMKQKTDESFSFIPWDTNFENLKPFVHKKSLSKQMQLTIFEGKIKEAIAEKTPHRGLCKIFFAYRLSSGKLVYNQTPLQFNII
jgi:hypothetical protein